MEVNNLEEVWKKKNGVTNGFCVSVTLHNITEMDISSKNLKNIDEIILPANLVQLNLSYNNLVTVPTVVLNLEKLKFLNLSHNDIVFFDETPAFCHTLEQLDLSNNKLKGPPCWIWYESPANMKILNLSYNPDITESLKNGYFEELMEYSTGILELELHNCKLTKHTQILATFPKLKTLKLGSEEFRYCYLNALIEMPCEGLEQCCDIERLNLRNTQIYTVSCNIDLFKNIVELDLSENLLHSLPNEFCNLTSLVKCALSYNKLLCLPDDMCKMKNLEVLLLDSNELCMLPDNFDNLTNLKTLDLYDNHLSDVPNYNCIENVDLAQNYLDEPNDDLYLEKRSRLRILNNNRLNGRKPEIVKPESEYSNSDCEDDDDDECYQICLNNTQEIDNATIDPPSSPEDWDSDDYWIPGNVINKTVLPQSPWLYYVKQKIEEGNFCPIDAHIVSISEKVKYDKLRFPEVIYESDGQFDDYSSDDT